MPQIQRNPHCVNQFNYPFVRVPRYRHKVLSAPVANRLKEICHQVAVELGVEILALEVLPDHVHLFVSCPPKWSPSEIVRRFKGRSSRLLMLEFPHLIQRYWGIQATLWAESY
jgi:putative transposase